MSRPRAPAASAHACAVARAIVRWKRAAISDASHAGRHLQRDGGDRPAGIEDAAGDVERIGAVLAASADRLELHRRLALVA